MNTRIIISGGGTGGHIYPAIAIADAIRALEPAAEILFVGAQGRMEMEKVPQAGYKIEGLWISGLQRKLTLDNLSFPFKVVHSWWKSRQLIKSFRPQAVVGVGGYASGPMMQAALGAGIPTLIQEQNGYAGLTNKMVAHRVNRVCVAYPNLDKYFPKEKLVFTGNPVRKDIAQLEERIKGLKSEALASFGLAEGKPTLLVIGGSLGAKTLNDSLLAGVEALLNAGYQVIWQTGKYYYESTKAALAGKTWNGLALLPFIARMDYAYACADAVVSRAGALSISELCLAAKPSILVPSPNVAEDHQTKNALALVSEGAALLVKDQDARQNLIPEAIRLMGNMAERERLAGNIKKLARPNAARDVAKEVLALAKRA